MDAATGRPVHQMTNAAGMSHPTYFLQRSFTPDNRTLVFTSYRDENQAQLFEVGFPDGEIRQLTDGEAIHPFSPAILPGGEEIVFVRGGSIWTLRRDTLEERLVVDFPDGQLGECSFTTDGEWLTAAVKLRGEAGLVSGRTDGSEWRFIPFPRTVIHPQFHPREAEWIEFAADPAPRMHRVRRDGSGLECLYQHGNHEFVVHETFLGETGDLVYTVWPHSLKRMNWKTLEHTPIAEFNAWHITPNREGTKVLCDTNHPDRGLFLIDVATGAAELLCLSESSNAGSQWKTSRYALAADFAAARSEAAKNLSWMEAGAADTVYGPQWTHPHPSFSPDETLVAFASDRTGVTQVFVADIRERRP
ncbi:MAG TPA: hypothetical protein VGL53_28445 [Bryobacteraceae bacterium]|jgi:hypothetical protein